ncbi:MAG: hypothetical protein A2V66_12235 [Ignavibacteria bacterium RBG_13_36_8]|nr:MAG: hypothetical protein A2V66_12235 [Ignavibacteria bacterium RBG_13_36_8]
MRDFKKLAAWQKSRELVNNIYEVTKKFPKEEVFGLTNQVRKSAVSITSNIAEGAGRSSNKEFKNFLEAANSSAFELETLLILATDQGYFWKSDLEILAEKIHEIQKLIHGNIKPSKSKRA